MSNNQVHITAIRKMEQWQQTLVFDLQMQKRMWEAGLMAVAMMYSKFVITDMKQIEKWRALAGRTA